MTLTQTEGAPIEGVQDTPKPFPNVSTLTFKPDANVLAVLAKHKPVEIPGASDVNTTNNGNAGNTGNADSGVDDDLGGSSGSSGSSNGPGNASKVTGSLDATVTSLLQKFKERQGDAGAAIGSNLPGVKKNKETDAKNNKTGNATAADDDGGAVSTSNIAGDGGNQNPGQQTQSTAQGQQNIPPGEVNANDNAGGGTGVVTFNDPADIANFLAEKGLIVDVPEGFDVSNVNPESLWELLDHNVQRKATETFTTGYQQAAQDIASKLDPRVLDIVQFQLDNQNLDERDVEEYIVSVIQQSDVAALDPENVDDAKSIIWRYMSADSSAEEIEEEIKNLENTGRLNIRAATLKPKLEAKAVAQKQAIEQQRKRIKDQDAETHLNFLNRVANVLRAGTLNGVKLSTDDAARVFTIFENNRVPVKVAGGKQVDLTGFEYLARLNMHDAKNGNIENLVLAAMVLEGGVKAIEKYVARPTKNEEVVKFRNAANKGQFASGGAATSAAQIHNPAGAVTQQSAANKAEEFWKTFSSRRG